MIESSLIAWLFFIGLVGLSTFSGVILSSCMPWKKSALQANCSLATGILLGPLLTGLSAVVALLVLPQAQSLYHILFVVALLLLIVLGCYCKINHDNLHISLHRQSYDAGTLLMIFFLCLWIFALAINTIFLPLMQNDALEYATVGRLLYESKTLNIYPVLDPANSAGFYGPWTHPPLYVALLYLAAAIQGHAHAPGLMRLIAPWFLIVSTVGVIALGALKSLRLGLLSGILFISTPLLFLGADSALIDALPTSGIVLLMLVMVGLSQSRSSSNTDSLQFDLEEQARSTIDLPPIQNANALTRLHGVQLGAWLGLALGLSLWTHSQAILFIPLLVVGLFLLRGLLRWRQVFVEWASALVVALMIAGLPYYHNVMIFGSPISDNPVVFALKELDWQGYFRFARGLDTWQSIIQYGVFKGWFSLEAYGLDFWLMTIGLIALFKKYSWKQISQMLRSGVDEYPIGRTVLLFSAGWILTYLSGVVLSVILGTDLMIRNERYMLVIIPAVVLCGGFGVSQFANSLNVAQESQNQTRVTVKGVLFYIIGILLLVMQLVVVGWYYRWRNVSVDAPQQVCQEGKCVFYRTLPSIYNERLNTRTSQINISSELQKQNTNTAPRLSNILSNYSAFNVMQILSKIIADDSLVLSMRPADMYYSNKKMVSYLDPRLLPVYLASSVEIARKELALIGVQYIHIVDYSLPPLFNSLIQNMIANPKLSRLIYSAGMFQVYALQDSGLKKDKSWDLTPGTVPWTKTVEIRFGSRKNLLQLGIMNQNVKHHEMSSTSFPIFHRDYSTMVCLGSVRNHMVQPDSLFKLEETTEYLIQLNLIGHGFVRTWITQYDGKGKPIYEDRLSHEKRVRMGELALTEQYPKRSFLRRFRPFKNAKFAQICLEHMGRSSVTINRATLTRLAPEK